ncbi:MAG: FtsQ-type POTRA domain-containing protein [Deltaproteobacteria bacterium]|nr:FtsQ-type POTRA domain-containing protein [Deltaproteobacteria bacterium]
MGTKESIVRTSSLVDRASVRGVKKGRGNRKKGSRRQSTLQGLRVVGGLVLGAALLGGLGYGAHQARRWAHKSPRFALDTIEVVGAGRASEESLLRLSGLRRGLNIFDVDVDRVAEAVEAHPWVAAAQVERRFPRGVRVTVREHQPALMVALDHLYYADASGEVVKRYAPGEREVLPVVTGLERAQVEADDPAARALLEEAVALLDAVSAVRGGGAEQVAEVHVDPVMGLSFVLRDDEARVEVGHAPFEEKLRRLAVVQSSLRERGVLASRITLSGERRPERVVARLARRQEVSSGAARAAAAPRVTDESSRPEGLARRAVEGD